MINELHEPNMVASAGMNLWQNLVASLFWISLIRNTEKLFVLSVVRHHWWCWRVLYAHLCLLLLQRALFSVSIVPFQLQWKCLVIHAKEKPRLEKNAFRLLDYVFLYTTGPKVIGFSSVYWIGVHWYLQHMVLTWKCSDWPMSFVVTYSHAWLFSSEFWSLAVPL